MITEDKRNKLWEEYQKALKAWKRNANNWMGWQPSPPNE